MNKAGICALLLQTALAGCATSPPTVPQTHPVSSFQQFGEKRWFSPKFAVEACDGPRDWSKPLTAGNCRTMKQGSFTVIRPGATRHGVSFGYYIRIDGEDRERFIDSLALTDSEEIHRANMAEKAACDKKGGVRVGMTREQVYASCWGKPGRINTTTGSYGTHEQLVYGSSYLYLENGVLRTIQTSE